MACDDDRAKRAAIVDAGVMDLSSYPTFDEMTCATCPAALNCNYAFDTYNTDGDCLAEK